MRRMLFLALMVATARCAVAADGVVPTKKCVAAGSSLAAVPQDQLTLLRIDSELTLLAANAARQPELALPLTRTVAAEIQGLPNGQLRGVLDGRLAHVYWTLNREEASEWLASLPSRAKLHTYNDYKAQAYNQAIAAAQDQPKLQMELMERGLSTGALQILQVTAQMQKLQKQSPDVAMALFAKAIAAFPADAPTDQDVRFLYRLAAMMVGISTDNAAKAVTLMLAALDNPNLQSMPQKDLPKSLPAGFANDRNSALRSQVERLAVQLHLLDKVSNQNSAAQTAASRRASQSAAATSLSLDETDGTGHSAEYQSAVKALNGAASSNGILSLANSISDSTERAQFYALVLRKLQGRSASIAPLAGAILSATEHSDDPEVSLAAPQTILQAALTTNDAATAQLALASLARVAVNLCDASRASDGDAGYAKGSSCIQTYSRVAAEISRSPLRQMLQVSDPSLLQRLEMSDAQRCLPSSDAVATVR